VITLNLDFGAVLKFGDWAINLSDEIDFIDYWYNLTLSRTKAQIESDPMSSINAFHWTRWQEDFEEFVDKYQPKAGNGFTQSQREWFAAYTHYLVCALGLPSKAVAVHYGAEKFTNLMDGWSRYHTFGVDQFVESFISEYGTPPNSKLRLLYM
jgi:hypothetical protein